MPDIADTRWERLGALGGIVFVVAMFVIVVVTGQGFPEDPTSQELAAYYDQNQAETIWIPLAAMTLGGLGLLWFLGSLRSTLRRAEGGIGRLSGIATIAGAGSLILLLAAGGIFVSLGFSATDSDNVNFVFDASTHDMVENAGFGLYVLHVFLGGALVVASSVVSIRARIFPPWFNWVGVVLGIVALTGPFTFFVGLLAYWLWIVIAAGFLLAGRGLRPAGTLEPG